MSSLLLGGFLVLVGAILFIIGFVATRRSKTAQSWPTASGIVLNSDVQVHVDYDSDHGSSTTYEPVVTYQYSIMGQNYTATRIAFGANRFGRKKAYEIASKYPAGAQVIVHYNPDKVSDATLEVVARGGTTFIIIGIIGAVIGLVIAVFSLVG
jgi:hypothetical protein